MSLFPAFIWVSIIWLTSAFSVAASASVDLQASSNVVARCGENVTLTCYTSHQLDIKLFSWVGRNKTCQYGDPQADPGILCESESEANRRRLSMTLLNVMPFNQGDYHCKLRSTQAVKSAKTAVSVQDCLEHCHSFINESHAYCWFSGLYPSGVIHWFQNEVNLTDSSSMLEEEEQHGRYKVCSTLDVQKGNLSQPYGCSLWIPSAGKYLTSKKLYMVKELRSSGDVVKLHWVFIMVEILVVTFVT